MLNSVAPLLLAPLFGIPPGLYRLHHCYMHHVVRGWDLRVPCKECHARLHTIASRARPIASEMCMHHVVRGWEAVSLAAMESATACQAPRVAAVPSRPPGTASCKS